MGVLNYINLKMKSFAAVALVGAASSHRLNN